MTLGDIQNAASQNLIQTYIRLGMATPGAVWSRETGFDLCLGDLNHPICNFAANLNLDPWSARKLASIAQDRPTFNVYFCSGDRPEYLEELLVTAGFFHSYRLIEMACEPIEEGEVVAPEACSPTERLPVACFMADQFFAQRSADFRIAVARATALAPGVELRYSGDSARPNAAVMLSEAAGMLGCYNLCVAPAVRGRGIGSSLVRWVLAEAWRRGMLVTIQCEPYLESWYGTFGFKRCGWLNVYQLSKAGTSDIIELN